MNHISKKYSYSIIIICTLIILFGDNIFAQKRDLYSQIWGKNGEKWDKSRIPDFTQSGYKSGNQAIPVYKTGVNIKDYGAVGDGIADDTQALKKAIAQCPAGKALYIPAGTYRLTDTIQVRRSGISLRGDKNMNSILYFDKGIEELYPKYNISSRQSSWSWSGGMILFAGDIADSGIEYLTIKFPDNKWAGHDFHEKGYNAIGFSQKAHDGWIRNIKFVGVDMGIWIERSAHHITAENWVTETGPVRDAENLNGHHAVALYGGYNIMQNFEIKGRYQHDLSVESAPSVYNVFRNGKGEDLCIDHHNHAQVNNLFTNINAGAGKRLYASGGNDTPRGISFKETYWNIYSDSSEMGYPSQKDDKVKQSSNNVAVGVKTQIPSMLGDAHGNWYENIEPARLFPADLYEAQMKLKKKKLQ